ncbi:hypothetical protein EI74_0557 [Mycoplasma testudineum]|uniref:Uncharacterized protein n=1 Tax=Mycoplasma testudineum TaxID=244584 RepID=A0A4R6IE65_9MOLU|nr:hypothetical protein [Mycoplasma testudineum]OYD26781.1 hypothetical protein CG473_02395 [Mycoplasma testudineum]TDO19917.1 hypothetical protein EI74_0557 [Mycoplasma testudineum]
MNLKKKILLTGIIGSGVIASTVFVSCNNSVPTPASNNITNFDIQNLIAENSITFQAKASARNMSAQDAVALLNSTEGNTKTLAQQFSWLEQLLESNDLSRFNNITLTAMSAQVSNLIHSPERSNTIQVTLAGKFNSQNVSITFFISNFLNASSTNEDWETQSAAMTQNKTFNETVYTMDLKALGPDFTLVKYVQTINSNSSKSDAVVALKNILVAAKVITEEQRVQLSIEGSFIVNNETVFMFLQPNEALNGFSLMFHYRLNSSYPLFAEVKIKFAA